MQTKAPGRRKTYEVQRKAVESISTTEQTQENQAPEQVYAAGEILRQAKFSPRGLSSNSVLQLQRTLGNQAVQRLLARPSTPVRPAPHPARVMRRSVWGTGRTGYGGAAVVQRSLRKLPGKSSGWFRKGRRDKINSMVEAYNVMEMKYGGAKKSAAGYQILIAELNKIWEEANQWKQAVAQKSPDKAVEIQKWMDDLVVADWDLKTTGIQEMQQVAVLEDAWKGAKYNSAYATPAYTSSGDAGINWLATPEIAPVFKYHIIKNQFDGLTLNAYEDILEYKKAPAAEKALQIYDKYDMGTASKLNITGEGAGGISGINTARATIEPLRQDPSNPPANFGAIEKSIIHVINEIMISFRMTPQYQKITTAPDAT